MLFARYHAAMPRVHFTENLQRHVPAPSMEAAGTTVRLVLDAVFHARPDLRLFIVEETGELRAHIVVFVDGRPIRDRAGMSDAVQPASELHVMQALSGG